MVKIAAPQKSVVPRFINIPLELKTPTSKGTLILWFCYQTPLYRSRHIAKSSHISQYERGKLFLHTIRNGVIWR